MHGAEDTDMVDVVGAGAVGNNIMQMAAIAGYDAVMRDLEPEYVEHGLSTIDDSLSRFVSKEKLTGDETDTVRARVVGTTELAGLGDCDLVVEAAVENVDAKRDILADLDDIAPEGVVLTANTSTLSITTIAAATERPKLAVSPHFMNPVPIMKGIETVHGEKTDDDVTAFTHDFPEALGRETWEFDDKPGSVADRTLMPRLNEGIHAYNGGVASRGDIDHGMTLGTNVPMGPLTLVDHIGLDTCLDTSEMLFEELGDRYKPAYLPKHKVAVDDLGKKTGKGFYKYD